jgi:hypothetical protein
VLFTNSEELGVYPRLWKGSLKFPEIASEKNGNCLSVNTENYSLWNIASCDTDVTKVLLQLTIPQNAVCTHTFPYGSDYF